MKPRPFFFAPPPPLNLSNARSRYFPYEDCVNWAKTGEWMYLENELKEFQPNTFDKWLKIAEHAAQNGHETIVLKIMDRIWEAAPQGRSYAKELALIAVCNGYDFPAVAAKLFNHARKKATPEEHFEINKRISQLMRHYMLIAVTRPGALSTLPSKLAPLLLLYPVEKRVYELRSERNTAQSCNVQVDFAAIEGEAFLLAMAQAALDYPFVEESAIVRQFMKDTAGFRQAAKDKTPLDNQNSFISTLPTDIQKHIVLCLADPLLHAPVKAGVGLLWTDLLLAHSDAQKKEVVVNEEKLTAAAKRLEAAKLATNDKSKTVLTDDKLSTKSTDCNAGTKIPGYTPCQSEVKDSLPASIMQPAASNQAAVVQEQKGSNENQGSAPNTQSAGNPSTLGTTQLFGRVDSRGNPIPNYVSEVVKKLNEQQRLTKKR